MIYNKEGYIEKISPWQYYDTTFFEYNNDNLMIKSLNYVKENHNSNTAYYLRNYITYTYDNKNRIIADSAYSVYGNYQAGNYTKYEYDNIGNCIRASYFQRSFLPGQNIEPKFFCTSILEFNYNNLFSSYKNLPIILLLPLTNKYSLVTEISKDGNGEVLDNESIFNYIYESNEFNYPSISIKTFGNKTITSRYFYNCI